MNKELLKLLPIETKRLVIKKTTLDDVDLLLKLDKQEETQRYLGGIKNKTKEERISFLKKKENSLTVFLKDNTKIGFIGFKIEKNIATLSYIFDNDYTNNGCCTEACSALISFSNKLNISKMVADVVENNNPSRRVLEKLGFLFVKSKDEDQLFLEFEKRL